MVDDAIGESDWLLGKRFSAADIYLFMLTTWLNESLEHPSLESFPNVERVATEIMNRPSVARIYSSYISDRLAGKSRDPWPGP